MVLLIALADDEQPIRTQGEVKSWKAWAQYS